MRSRTPPNFPGASPFWDARPGTFKPRRPTLDFAYRMIASSVARRAKSDCAVFAEMIMRDENGRRYANGQHHRRYHAFLDEHPRAVILAPVEHGKTQQITILRTIWTLGRNPRARCAIVCNTFLQATKVTRSIREIIEGSEDLRLVFPSLWPGDPWSESRLNVAGHPRGAKDFSLEAFGVHGSVLGARLDWIVLDDICDYENTRTETGRRDLERWVRSTLLTRLTPEGRCVVIGTSWHQDDLYHSLIRSGWPGIIDRAVLDDGTSLWPERWPLDRLHAKRREIGEIEFARQFQNDIKAYTGGMFREEWFRFVDPGEVPETADVVRVRAWDLAATSPSDGAANPDWTVGALVAMHQGRYYVLDIQRVRASPGEVQRLVRACAEADGRDTCIVIEQEPGAAGKSLIDHYIRSVLPGWAVYGRRGTGSKIVRAQPLAAAMEAGNVYLVRAPWNRSVVDELAQFPHGPHDDQVDALSEALQALTQIGPARLATTTHGLWAR